MVIFVMLVQRAHPSNSNAYVSQEYPEACRKGFLDHTDISTINSVAEDKLQLITCKI